MDKIKTSKIAAFLNVTPEKETPTWERIRKQGELKFKYDAQTTDESYIDEDTATTNIDSYNVSFDGELVAHTGDPIFAFLDELRQNRAVDASAETQCVIVYLYDGDSAGGYAAEQNACTIQISEFGGEGGGGNSSISYTCTFCGDPTLGTATVTDGALAFTPNAG